jgi:indole-3-glycerol phosphate synthase
MSQRLLDTVVAAARRAAQVRASRTPAPSIDRQPRGDLFETALAEPGIRVIAECKRRSPSRGVLTREYDPVAIAGRYAARGAAAISVLTEPTFFDGSLDHLRAVRQSVDLPLLRKDFIVDTTQIREAAAAGADAVLLIVTALGDDDLRGLAAAAQGLGLAVLVEVHDEAELDRALEAGARVVGVNSRNLRTLDVRTEIFDALAPRIPSGVVAVAESGLKSGDDLKRLADLRYDAFLIGERFMTDDDPGTALAGLLAEARRSSGPQAARTGRNHT